MATRIWRDEVLRLIRDEAAQLVEVIPPPKYEDDHIEDTTRHDHWSSQGSTVLSQADLPKQVSHRRSRPASYETG